MNVAGSPIVLGSAGLLLVAVSLHDHAPRIVWNASASVPIGLYVIRRSRSVHVGDIVAVRPPQALSAWLADRGYLGRNSMLLKRVAAVEGDVVCRHQGAVLIEGHLAATAQDRDSSGRSLPVWSACRKLAHGDVFLLNEGVSASFDGRYFGPLDRRSIVGVAMLLLAAGG